MTTLHLGDCLEVLRAMTAASVDAVVTDPPYELGFMGKAWDASGIAFRPDTWREVLRVLKPGGHLLAFAGSRTYHRIACAIEDAGFEVRDQIMWIYGSGFPKSLDVGKAIDKARDDRRDVLRVTTFMSDAADRCGITRADVDAAMGTSDMGGWWLSRLLHRCQCPKWEQWLQLKVILSLSDEMDADVWRLNGRKGTPGNERSDREVTAPGANAIYQPIQRVINPGTPVLDAARQWTGWGTALKPAHEPIVVARKPLGSGAVNVAQNVERALRARGVTGEIRWTEPASDAASFAATINSSSIEARPAAEMSAAHADAPATQSDGPPTDRACAPTGLHGEIATDSTSSTTTNESAKNCATPSLAPTVDDAGAAGSASAHSSRLTTSTAAEPLTGEPSTARSTNSYGAKDFPPATESFAGIATGLTGSLAHAHINRTPAGFVWPDDLPTHMPATASTVAANVLAHGTGAINVDACRIETGDGLNGGAYSNGGKRPEDASSFYTGTTAGTFAQPSGRWPANVIHDGSEEVVALFPDVASGVAVGGRGKASSIYGTALDRSGGEDHGYADTGSAARFFYCAKASAEDRDEGCRDLPLRRIAKLGGSDNDRADLDPVSERFRTAPGRNVHPTVKPTDLMRYLVRLVTPPGGTVLDPFMGSGSTGKAAAFEGFGFVGIEREAEYFEIAKARIAYAEAAPKQVELPISGNAEPTAPSAAQLGLEFAA